MTAAKLLTGRDAPVSNMEMVLTNTYQVAQARLQKQQERAQRGSPKRRR